ncbi:TPA: fibronectin-binding protein PrtF1/SfbI [Streptococcus pyogenes]|uniref:fibronectin-binding protein PrtF1/SfbI n=1 Tax=Streptococcus pyogenes TaxID=1314 RepID=UPI0002E3DCC1|nr:fibronectin-binding protein PrtF1/SfbI [Streptococcus pyogenes]AKL62403.1 fibronectin-binding protein [Streptococcus pyogenes]ANP28788.1 fibronectin-binding protein [Streptococcus pyogenes]HEQ4334608.1 fibronectin-binding protein SfbI [Streptococcus pyogenes]HEQ4574398.1 fibronectin-binding protein SfbI [Streptococcus pyogenes]HEQ4599855.1 fibronectin-binding protein SfbI [Streptococcus pyogenes]
MNNKIFLNKEAGFLAHTKRKRRFAVTLVGVFFMLLACAGAIGFGQVAYAADEKTVPNFKSPDPDYPWYGYDAYTGAFLRYHDLRVNLNGSRSYQVYCFNIKKNYPRPFTSSDKKWYKRLEGTAETFKVHAMAPRVGGEELTKKLRSVMYNGYPNDGNNIMKGLEPSNAIEVTQYAVWYYSDKSQYEIETLWKSEAKEGKISESQVTLMREALRKLISSDEDLVKQVPSNFKLSTFESSDKSYQNLLSAEFVPDDPPKPGDTSEHNPKTPELDGSPIPEDPKHPDDNLEPTLPPVMLDGEEVPEVPSESLEPALPPLMPELDGEEVPEVPSESLEPALPPLMPELDGEEVPEVPSESLEPALPPLMPELDGEEVPEVPSESLEPALPPLMPELDGQEVPEKPSVDLPIEVPRYEFNNKDQSPLAGESGETEYITEVYGNQQNPVDIDKKLPNETGFSGNMVETEDTKEPEVLMGGQSESVEFTKDTQTGMSGQTTPQVETEDTKEPGVLMGGQSESVEFTKDTQTGMSGFSETVTIVEDTRPKLVFHFDNNEPKVEENREKPTKNITPILPATGDIGNVLAFLGILILSVLSIFSLLKNKQNNKV